MVQMPIMGRNKESRFKKLQIFEIEISVIFFLFILDKVYVYRKN